MMPPSEQADSEYQEIFDDESDGSLVFISWASNCSRSDNIARELGGKSYMVYPVSYTHLRAHETKANLVCRLLLEKKKK